MPAPETGVDVDAHELTLLRQQVAELQEENAALRKELAHLRAVAG
jgi:regulator of replication initiation timing